MTVSKVHLRGYRRVRRTKGRAVFTDTTICGLRWDLDSERDVAELYPFVTCKNCLRVLAADETAVPPYVREKNEPGRMVRSHPHYQPRGIE